MKYFLIALATLSVCLIATLAHATPKQGVEYTYETIKHSHDIIRHPDEVIIPPDPKNDDYQAYEHWRWLHPFVKDYAPPQPAKNNPLLSKLNGLLASPDHDALMAGAVKGAIKKGQTLSGPP